MYTYLRVGSDSVLGVLAAALLDSAHEHSAPFRGVYSSSVGSLDTGRVHAWQQTTSVDGLALSVPVLFDEERFRGLLLV